MKGSLCSGGPSPTAALTLPVTGKCHRDPGRGADHTNGLFLRQWTSFLSNRALPFSSRTKMKRKKGSGRIQEELLVQTSRSLRNHFSVDLKEERLLSSWAG